MDTPACSVLYNEWLVKLYGKALSLYFDYCHAIHKFHNIMLFFLDSLTIRLQVKSLCCNPKHLTNEVGIILTWMSRECR